MVRIKATFLQKEATMKRNWFMHPPYRNWLESIVSLIVYKAKHERSLAEIMNDAKAHGPEGGWDEETRDFARLAGQIAKRSVNEQSG